jgi:hypothetical protein
VRGIGILGSSDAGSCIDRPLSAARMASRAFTPREPDLHVGVLDRYAVSWFIVDSSWVSYDEVGT